MKQKLISFITFFLLILIINVAKLNINKYEQDYQVMFTICSFVSVYCVYVTMNNLESF